MRKLVKITLSICCIAMIFFPKNVDGQKIKKDRKHEFYFSWGYNTEWYTKSTIKIKQPQLGNDFEFVKGVGHDHRGWDGQFFTKALSIPQYNYRIGMFINKAKGLAFEINFDHTKFVLTDGGQVHIKGTLNNKSVDSNFIFSTANGDFWYLNNGANFLLFNVVKRWNLISKTNLKLDGLLKGGIGPVIPHVENSLFGNKNTPHFQFGGWNIGSEAALKATFHQFVYLELTNKLVYARYNNLKVFDGTAKQAFGCYEIILNLGFTFGVGKKVK